MLEVKSNVISRYARKILGVAVLAQNLEPPAGSIKTNIKPESLPQLVVNMLFLLAAFLAIAYMMYGGIRWITSRGDKMAVDEARKHVTAAVIGLVIVAGSFFILQVVFNVLGADNPLQGGFKLPTLDTVGK